MNLRTHFDLKVFVSPLRVCSLLEYNDESQTTREEQRLLSATRFDRFRTTFDEDWRDVLLRELRKESAAFHGRTVQIKR